MNKPHKGLFIDTLVCLEHDRGPGEKYMCDFIYFSNFYLYLFIDLLFILFLPFLFCFYLFYFVFIFFILFFFSGQK